MPLQLRLEFSLSLSLHPLRFNNQSENFGGTRRITIFCGICKYIIWVQSACSLTSPATDMAETSFPPEDDFRLETTRSRFSNVLKKHAELSERLSRDSDKSVFERLQKEFETARASQSQEIHLDGEEWNDGLLATIRERVHMEADRKAMAGDTTFSSGTHIQEKITYKVGNKVICCLEGARIGIQYETFFAGEPCELYHIVLESLLLESVGAWETLYVTSFLIKMIYFQKFIDRVGELLQAYVDRREQVRLIKELYGNQIGELYHSLPFNMVEFVLDDFECKVTVTLRYEDLICVLPTRIRVLAWPRKNCTSPVSMTRRGNGVSGSHPSPARLSYAEEALRSMSLPEAFAEIVLNLPQALQRLYQHAPSRNLDSTRV